MRLKWPASNKGGEFSARYNAYAISNFFLSYFVLDHFFRYQIVKIKYTIGICILNLEYFKIIANNTRETKNVCIFFQNKVYSNNLFLHLFLAQFHIFLFRLLASICYKIAWKKISAYKVNNYFENFKDKEQNDTLIRLCILTTSHHCCQDCTEHSCPNKLWPVFDVSHFHLCI